MSAIGVTLKRLLRLSGARAAFVLEDTAGGYTVGVDPGHRLVWSGTPGVAASGGLGGLGYASNTGVVSAAAEFACHPLGAAPRTVMLALRTLDTDGVAVAFGAASTNADDAFAVDSAAAVSWAHTGNAASVAAVLANNAWHLVVLRASKLGAYRIQIGAAQVAAATFPAGALNTAAGALQVFRHPSATPRNLVGDIAFVAVWDRELADAEVGDVRALLTDTHKLSGVAALSGGEPATAVLVRRVGDREHLLTIVPQAPSGAWEALVPPGDYEVSCVGPSGYQPQTFAPVVAVAV